MLGKRKRDLTVAPRQATVNEEDLVSDMTSPSGNQDVFRHYFESAFEPLPGIKADHLSAHEDKGLADQLSEEESDWEGLSDAGKETSNVQIVEHRTNFEDRHDEEVRRQHYKSFMTSKPPSQAEQAARKGNLGKDAEDEEESEAVNLKHDLDLQRLLKESHLLEQAKASSIPSTYRHKAVDMRMQTLGSKGSLFHQEKMPLSHRKGILAKTASREATRRKEAKENGIILEKATGKGKSKGARRERGVDVPAVGKFRGGTLRLSKHDVLDIQGPGRSGSRGKRGRR